MSEEDLAFFRDRPNLLAQGGGELLPALRRPSGESTPAGDETSDFITTFPPAEAMSSLTALTKPQYSGSGTVKEPEGS